MKTKNHLKKLLTSLVIFLYPLSHSFAVTNTSTSSGWGPDDIRFGIGNLTQFVKRVQVDDSGNDNGLVDLEPVLLLATEWRLFDQVTFLPELGTTIPKDSVDSNINRWTYFVNLNLGYRYENWLFFGGFGLYMTRLSSSGGTQRLQNGTGFTDFPLPSKSSTSMNVTTNLGVQYFFLKNWSAKAEFLIYDLTDSDSRAFGHLLSVNYHFGEFKWGQ